MCKEPAAAMVRKALASATVVAVTVMAVEMVTAMVRPVILAAVVPAAPKVVALTRAAPGQVRGLRGRLLEDFRLRWQLLEEFHPRNSGQHCASRQSHRCERRCCDSVRPRSPQSRSPRSTRRPLSCRNCIRCWPLQRARRGNTSVHRTVGTSRLLQAR